MSGKVSVIIPAYNVEDYLEECVKSVFNQTYQNFEIIIVNDGSTDNTLKIAKEFEKKEKNVKVIDIENHGQGYARNLALKQAKGDYILFLDSDDMLEDLTLQLAVKKIEEEKSDLVVFDWKYYYEKNNTIKYCNIDKFFKNKILENENVIELLKIRHYFTVNKLYSKKFLLDNDIKYGEGYIYEDIPFWVKVSVEARKVSLIHSPLYTVRVSKKSTTKTNYETDKHAKGFIYALEDTMNIIKKYPNNDYSYLYAYCAIKFEIYYLKRVPKSLKKEFVQNYLKVMSEAKKPEKNTAKCPMMKICFKHKVFEKNKKVLFYISLLIDLAYKALEVFTEKVKRKIKKFLLMLIDIKEGNYQEYKKAQKNTVKEDAVVFMGFNYKFTGNSRYLYEELIQKKKDNVYFVTNSLLVDEKNRIKPNSREMYKKIYNSKLVIFESWIDKKIKKTENTTWIQLWHGTPLKKMLYDSDEAEIFSRFRNHKINKFNDIKNWDYLILDNPNIYNYFSSAFLIPKEKTLECGYPRVKYLVENINNEKLKKEIRKKHEIPENKKIVAYLPTWRDYNYRIDNGDLEYLLKIDELKEKLGDEYQIVCKDHIFLKNNDSVINNMEIETQELLLISDYLITDYSSVMFDAFAIDLPVVLLANDYEKYSKSRGVYKEMWKDLEAITAKDEKEIINKMNDYSVRTKAYKNIKEKYAYISNLNLVEFILKLEKGE